MECKCVDVDHGRFESGIGQYADLALDQFALGSHEQDVHLDAVRVGIQDLEVEFHRLHVERHVLLGFPAHEFARLLLLHALDLDFLDDHVASTNCRHHGLGRHARSGQTAGNGFGHNAGIHDLPLDDGVGEERRDCHLDELGLRLGVINHGHLDQAGTDIETHCGLLATEKRHAETAPCARLAKPLSERCSAR